MDSRTTYPTSSAQRPARMRPLNWVLLVAGVLLTALGLGLTLGGAVLMSAESAQQDGQYLTLDPQRYQSTGHAITTPSLVLDPGESGTTGLPPLEELASIQVKVTPVVPDQAIFVGIGDASEVAAYLDDVPSAAIGGMTWTETGQLSGQWSWNSGTDGQLQDIPGDRVPASPADQDFWAVSAMGTGTQEVTFDLQEGQWTLVVMNADATRPVWIDLQAGARTDLLNPVNPGLLITGLIALLLGLALLLLGTRGLGRDIDQPTPSPLATTGDIAGGHPTSGATRLAVHPLSFTGHLDTRLSRGLWLIKWLLAIPHYLILALLWFALVITTIAAGIAILFTGRYPRSWFAFSVGVLRWNWRVGFYAYSTLGTDQYPPFTLARADYPAELAVDYPDRLSRGLVLVKWWLLAIPHLLILGILTGSTGAAGMVYSDEGWTRVTTGGSPSLLGLLVLIAAVGLLFTGRYLPGLFALIVGLNRWVYRVATYVLLLRDDYPPFRLDQGPTDLPHPGEPAGSETITATTTPHPPSAPA
ncbi:hypothetical protein COCCU_14305 (plasmid) [Corynebacterium occultum]|uniref:DUF4389 domain-containing protein n=1 Tax=Corynebacterium occultum TaxID=2675219 RepID=A0A6B8W7Y1_9CORY|nr:DUF4389 domain-containing protein [Corynebacterium occultum]QGU08751.1 hypothetical protein COCCU_14305 [Corynebacterium occultum]